MDPPVTDSSTISVTIRYFAMLRELLGRSEDSLTLPGGTTAGAIYPMVTADHPNLARLQRSLMLMVNGDYVRGDRELADGDEVAFIPPVSGGDDAPPRFLVTADELDPRAIEALVAADDKGALATFTGTVRNHARGQAVLALDYEAYVPAAEKQLAVIGAEISERWPGVETAIHHRTGYLEPGVASVVIACSSAHRAEAFAAASHAIERIKQIVPIWKKEHYADGSTWIGSEADYQAEMGEKRREERGKS
jgi:molybdopterin converting factor subunit 1